MSLRKIDLKDPNDFTGVVVFSIVITMFVLFYVCNK